MTFVLVLICWFIFNNQVTPQIVAVGIGLSICIQIFVTVAMPSTGDTAAMKARGHRPNYFLRFFYYLKYVLVLIWEIIKANIVMVKIVCSRQMEFEPRLITFTTDLKEPTSRVLLANSITLTPGTITVKQEDDKFLVHCLDVSMGDGIDESVFVQQLRRIEEI